ncbi:tRNA processing endoribonuclease protein [Rutstroemia sp. NJR-2017a BVV2]|nr:tRNA processing endoribonuclease protein [Rutstroemia sp. NJR-2017a BVV2]
MQPISRACKTCATAKAKCVPRSGELGAKCERQVLYVTLMVHELIDKYRCHRLKKECQSQALQSKVRKRRKTTRVAQLEEKLDGIVSLLQEQKRSASQDVGAGCSPDHAPAQQVSEPTVPKSSPALNEPPQLANLALPDLNSKDHPSSLPPPSPPLPLPLPLPNQNPLNTSSTPRPSVYTTNTTACLLAHQHEDLSPSDPELEQLIHLYRTELTPRFPFVVLELRPGMSGKEWMAENPLLGKAVLMAASYYNLPRQTRLDVQIVRELAERVLVAGEKTLEGLQAILVFCAWWVGGFVSWGCDVGGEGTALMRTYGSIAVPKPSTTQQPTQYSSRHDWAPGTQQTAYIGQVPLPVRNQQIDEYGAEYASQAGVGGVVSTGFQRLDAMKYPVYLDECCRVIAEEKEYPTDVLLLELVKITDLAERIVNTTHMAQRESEMSVPVALQLGAYTAELKALKMGIPQDWKDNTLLQMHHTIASTRLYEIALSPHFQASSSLFPTHLAALHTLLNHTSHFIELTLSLPVEIYLALPLTPCALLAYALMVLARLSFFTCRGWDLEVVRGVCDLAWVLGVLAERDEGVKFVGGRGGGVDGVGGGAEDGVGIGVGENKIIGWNGKIKGWTDRMDKFAAKVRIVKGWYEKKVVKAGWGVERGSGRLRGKDDGLGVGLAEGDGEIGGHGGNGNAQEEGVSRDGGLGEENMAIRGEIDANTMATATHDGNGLGDLDIEMWRGLDEPDGWMDWCGDWDGEIGGGAGAFVGGGS